MPDMMKKCSFKIIFFIILLFLTTTSILFFRAKKINQTKLTEAPGKVQFDLNISQKEPIIFPSPVEIILTINKNDDSDAVGFDAIINYDDTILSLKSSELLIVDYDLFTYKQPNYLILTGIKKPSVKQTSLLQQQNNVVKIVFQPVRLGKTSVKLIKTLKKDRSKVINEKSQNVLDLTSLPFSVLLKIERK
jgi:hypothetical protein